MDQIRIKAEARAEQGTAAVRRLRRAGLVPASVMSMNKGGTKLIKFDAHEFMMAMRGRSGKQLLVTLDVQGKEVPALLREMQNDVLAGTPIHVDFSEVSLSQKVRVTVPLRLVGEAVGVKLGGGVLEQVLRSIEVECLPTDIVEKFDVDVSALGLDQTLFVRDLQLGDKFTLVTRGEYAAAVVKAPEGADATAGAAAAAGLVLLRIWPNPVYNVVNGFKAAVNAALDHLSNVGYFSMYEKKFPVDWPAAERTALIRTAVFLLIVYSPCGIRGKNSE